MPSRNEVSVVRNGRVSAAYFLRIEIGSSRDNFVWEKVFVSLSRNRSTESELIATNRTLTFPSHIAVRSVGSGNKEEGLASLYSVVKESICF